MVIEFVHPNHSLLFAGNDTSGSSGKGHIASRAAAGDKVNVGIGVISSAVIPNDIQSRDRVAVFVDGVHVLVNADAVNRGEKERTGAYAVIWRLSDL